MKVSEIKGERALDVLADILEPSAMMFGSDEFKTILAEHEEGKINRMQAITKVIKRFKSEIIEILAIINSDNPEKFEINLLTLPKQIMELLDDKELMDFFKSQVQNMADDVSGLATENTEVEKK